MVIKTVIVIILFIILFSLGSSLFFMIRDKGRTHRSVKALTWRVALSLGLFILLMIAYATGLITPHGIYPVPPS